MYASNRVVGKVLLAAALALAAVQTVGPNRRSPLGIDEQITYYLAAGQQPPTVLARCLEQSATPPLYFWLAKGSLRFGEILTPGRLREWWLRFPAWLSLLLAILVVARLAEGLLGPGSGAAAALLLAGHTEVLYYATQARPYTLGTLLSTVAFWCLCRLRAPGWSPKYLVGLIAADVGLIWTHYVFAVLIPTQLLLLPLVHWPGNGERENATRPALAKASLAAILLLLSISAVPLLPGIFRLIACRPFLNWITEIPAWYRPLGLLELGTAGWWPLIVVVTLAALVLLAGKVRGRPANGSLPAWPASTGLALSLWLIVPIYALWLSAWLGGASLAQARYIIVQAAAAVLLVTFVLRCLVEPRALGVLALVLLLLSGTPGHVSDILSNPVRHDRYWQEAALLLNDRAGTDDLVLVQSGLVETVLVPTQYADPGFHEYTTSRLSDFYLDVDLRRCSLPLRWVDADWQRYFADLIKATTARGGRVWLVISADSDLGQAVEHAAIRWLTSMGLSVQPVSDERVAKVYVCQPAD